MNDKKFILPEKWYIQWRSKECYEVIQDYLDKKYPDKYCSKLVYDEEAIHSKAFVNHLNEYCSYTNYTLLERWKRNEFIEITFEQFEKYVLNKSEINQDHSHLISLLSNIK